MTLTAETASGFYHFFKPDFLKMCATDLRQVSGLAALRA